MRLPGIEPGTVDLETTILPLNYSLRTPSTGFEPARAHAHLFSKQVPLPLGTMMATTFIPPPRSEVTFFAGIEPVSFDSES
jgi:hypothetical protein